MSTPQYIPDFTKSGKEMLIDLINWGNSDSMVFPLTVDNTFFTKPCRLTTEADLNTAITLAKVIGFHIPQDSDTIYYNRLDINQLALSLGFHFQVMVDTSKPLNTTHDLLEALYEVFKVKLLPEDVVEEPISIKDTLLNKTIYPDRIDGYKPDYPEVTLTIADDSIAYLGKLTFTVMPKPVNIKTAIRTRRFKRSFRPPNVYGLS